MRGVKKYLGLLAMLLVMSVFGGTLISRADTAKNVYVGVVSDYSTDYTLIEISGSNPQKVDGVSWDADNGILTFNGYNGGPVCIYSSRNNDYDALYDSLVPIEVRVIGENTIHTMSDYSLYRDPEEDESLYIYRGDVRFTGSGNLTIESVCGDGNNGIATRAARVFGNLTVDGPNIIIPGSSDGIYNDEARTEQDDENVYVGGKFTLKSGTINIEMIPILDYGDLYYYLDAALYAKDIVLEGGKIIIDMGWAGDESTNDIFPGGAIVAGNSFEAKDTTIVVNADDRLSKVPTVFVPEYDSSGNWIQQDDGTYKMDASKIKISDSVSIYRGIKGEKIDISNSEITLSPASFVYDGKEKKPAVTVKGLKEGTDYTVAYANNVKAGTATVTVTGKGLFTGTKSATFKINKANNTLKLAKKTLKVKYAKLKKKNQSVSAKKIVKKSQGKLTYKKVKLNKKKYAKKFSINKKTGKITVKKGVPKGKYKMTVKVTAAGNTNYNKATKKVVVTINVK